MNKSEILEAIGNTAFTFDPERCNHMGKSKEDCEHCQRRRKHQEKTFWAMRYKLDGHIDHLSLRRTRKHCLEDFEESFGQRMTPEFMSGWECVKVQIVEVKNVETAE